MANRPIGFGMTAELAVKRAAKFDSALADEAMHWIAEVLKTGNSEDKQLVGQIRRIFRFDMKIKRDMKKVTQDKDVFEPLKDGVILCHVINIIKPGSVKKINTNKMAFKQMENIGNFLAACESTGMAKQDLFQTVDLYEAANITQVVNAIFALGRKSQKIGYRGPKLGPEEATENRREFTEEQLRARDGVIGLQAGSNKGATQAGQNFGKTRAIID